MLLTEASHKEARKKADKDVKQWIGENIKEGATVLKLDNFKTGKVEITRASEKSVLAHFNTFEENYYTMQLLELLPNAKFLENAAIVEKANAKRKRGVVAYNYYEVIIEGKKYRLNMELHSKGIEIPYAINKIKGEQS